MGVFKQKEEGVPTAHGDLEDRGTTEKDIENQDGSPEDGISAAIGFDRVAERKVARKIDFNLMPLLMVLWSWSVGKGTNPLTASIADLLAYLDRSTLGKEKPNATLHQAKSINDDKQEMLILPGCKPTFISIRVPTNGSSRSSTYHISSSNHWH